MNHYGARTFFFYISSEMDEQNLFSDWMRPVWEKSQRYAEINKPILFTFTPGSLNWLSVHGVHARATHKSF